jgi:hypothetical protein
MERGATATFDKNGMELKRNGKVVATGSRIQKKLYLMHFTNSSSSAVTALLFANRVPNSLQLWHERLGHASHSTVHHMHSSNLVDGLNIEKSSSRPPFCEGCVFGKQHRHPFPTSGRTRATKNCGLIHSDLCGPMPTPSPNDPLFFPYFSWRLFWLQLHSFSKEEIRCQRPFKI